MLGEKTAVSICAASAKYTFPHSCVDKKQVSPAQTWSDGHYLDSVGPSHFQCGDSCVINISPASLSTPWLRETASVTAPGHTRIPPTGTVRRGVSWSRFRNRTAYSATRRTTSNAILYCLSFSYSSNLASSRPFSPK